MTRAVSITHSTQDNTLEVLLCNKYRHPLTSDIIVLNKVAERFVGDLEINTHDSCYVVKDSNIVFWVYESTSTPAVVQEIDLESKIFLKNNLDLYMNSSVDVMAANAEAVMGDIYCLKPVVGEEEQRMICSMSKYLSGEDDVAACKIDKSIGKRYKDG